MYYTYIYFVNKHTHHKIAQKLDFFANIWQITNKYIPT